MESSKLSLSTMYRCCLLLAIVTFAAPPRAVGETKHAATKVAATHSWTIRRQPAQLVNGAPVVIEVAPPVRLTALSAKWLEHRSSFQLRRRHKSLVRDCGSESGDSSGDLRSGSERNNHPSSTEITFSQNITVRAAKYPSIAVTVAKRFTEPSKEQLERIHQDKTVKQDVFQHTDPEREWSGKFRAPVDVPVSDVFGTRRTFNGKVQSMHQGLDYAAPTGTPVSAVNSGTVLLAGPLYFEGNCVVLDHGQGLLTLYLHLSEIKVKQGERIAARTGDRSERRHGPGHRTSSPPGRPLAGCLSEPRHAA